MKVDKNGNPILKDTRSNFVIQKAGQQIGCPENFDIRFS